MFRGEMEQADDLRLLRRYAADGCARSFETVVRRHIAWVYASSLRQVAGDAHLAEDVTQAVFVLLARRAATLHDDTLLTGWLFNTLRFTAKEARRKAARRRKHESAAALIPETPAPTGIDRESWEAMAPLLDQAVASLKESDRQAVLLRFYEGRDFSDIARILGLAEPAARKRVSRAVERLGRFFKKRGISRPRTLVLALLLLLLTRPSDAAPLVPAILARSRAQSGPNAPSPAAKPRDSSRGPKTPNPRRHLVTSLAAGIPLLALVTSLVAWLADAPPPIDPHDFASPTPAIDPWPNAAGHSSLTDALDLSTAPTPRIVETPPVASSSTDRPAHPFVGVDAAWWVRQWFDPATGPATPQARRNHSTDPADGPIDPATGQPRPAPGAAPQDYVESYAQMGGCGGSTPAATPHPLGPVAGEINGAPTSHTASATSAVGGDTAAASRVAAVVETLVATSSADVASSAESPAVSGRLTPLTVLRPLSAGDSGQLRFININLAATGSWYVLSSSGAGETIAVIRRYSGADGSGDVVVENLIPYAFDDLRSVLRIGTSDPTPDLGIVMGPLLLAPVTSQITYAQTPEPCTPLLLTALALPLLTRRQRV
jgi:RNA polymerase sigma factor (sigma-70 family)